MGRHIQIPHSMETPIRNLLGIRFETCGYYWSVESTGLRDPFQVSYCSILISCTHHLTINQIPITQSQIPINFNHPMSG